MNVCKKVSLFNAYEGKKKESYIEIFYLIFLI